VFHCAQVFAAGKQAPFKIYGKAQSGLDRCDLLIQFVTIEWHRGFEAERIARAQARSDYTTILPIA
jgi:hypothetical protein